MNKDCVLVLDNIRSVENVGSIFRTTECLGVEKIVLIGTTPTPLDRFGRKRRDLAKISLGAEELVKWEYEKSIEPALEKLKAESYKIIALEQSERAVDIKNFQAPEKFALILGNEVDGVSKVALDASDKILEIKMKGKKESINVSVAGGIALFTLLNR
jgi:23S rRNA (guanosine2251-2'-O)-methyltransferase